MCLTTKDPTIKIAEEDITVYKCLDKKKVKRKGFFNRLFNGKYRIAFEAMNHNHEYKIGKLNSPIKIKAVADRYDEFSVEKGYHSFVDQDNPRVSSINALFIIPKGTKYIKGWYNDDENILNYVSETIIFVKEI